VAGVLKEMHCEGEIRCTFDTQSLEYTHAHMHFTRCIHELFLRYTFNTHAHAHARTRAHAHAHTRPPAHARPQHLVGVKVGDQRKFQITFPDDYAVELWQGMRANVEVSIRELFEWVLPPVRVCVWGGCWEGRP